VSKEKGKKHQRNDSIEIIRDAHSSRGVQAQDRLGRAAGEDAPVGALDGAASLVDGGSGNAAPGVHCDGAAAEALGDIREAVAQGSAEALLGGRRRRGGGPGGWDGSVGRAACVPIVHL
jgi:hypothetical protein